MKNLLNLLLAADKLWKEGYKLFLQCGCFSDHNRKEEYRHGDCLPKQRHCVQAVWGQDERKIPFAVWIGKRLEGGRCKAYKYPHRPGQGA